MEDKIGFTITHEKLNKSFSQYDANCNEILFINKALQADGITPNAVVVSVNGMYLLPGEAWGTSGNRNEWDRTKYNIVVPGGGEIWIVRKTYT